MLNITVDITNYTLSCDKNIFRSLSLTTRAKYISFLHIKVQIYLWLCKKHQAALCPFLGGHMNTQERERIENKYEKRDTKKITC